MRFYPSIVVLLFVAAGVCAQPYPAPEDVETLDGIITAYYEVVSASAGEARNWERDRSLHHPDAQVVILGGGADGTAIQSSVMTLAEYHEQTGTIAQSGFFEYEIHRVTNKHGPVAQIWSTYEWRNSMDGPVGGRGINSITLYHDGLRWWIMSWMFDARGNAPDIPGKYLPENDN